MSIAPALRQVVVEERGQLGRSHVGTCVPLVIARTDAGRRRRQARLCPCRGSPAVQLADAVDEACRAKRQRRRI
jgi:hypothetical protein